MERTESRDHQEKLVQLDHPVFQELMARREDMESQDFLVPQASPDLVEPQDLAEVQVLWDPKDLRDNPDKWVLKEPVVNVVSQDQLERGVSRVHPVPRAIEDNEV